MSVQYSNALFYAATIFIAIFVGIFFLLPDTRLIQQSFEASSKNPAGWINQTCVALKPLPSSIPVGFERFVEPTTFWSWAVFATD